MPGADDITEPPSGPTHGSTAGGGGAGALRDVEWDNPVAGVFDGIAAQPSVAKPRS